MATWSPDGGQIAFSGYDWGNEADVYVASPDLSAVQDLTTGDTAWAAVPLYSPDGTRLAFQGETDVLVMNADGTGAARLTTSGTEAFTGSFNPATTFDGAEPPGTAMLSVEGSNGATTQELYRMALDGSGRTLITSGIIDVVKWR